MDDYERRARRMDRVGFWIRVELAIAFLAPLVLAFLYTAAPSNGHTPFEPFYVRVIPWVGGVGVIVGLVGVIWFARIDPEAGERTWRYRDN